MVKRRCIQLKETIDFRSKGRSDAFNVSMDAKDRRESCQALLGSVAGALESQPCILFKPSDLAIKRVFSVLAVTQVEKENRPGHRVLSHGLRGSFKNLFLANCVHFAVYVYIYMYVPDTCTHIYTYTCIYIQIHIDETIDRPECTYARAQKRECRLILLGAGLASEFTSSFHSFP